MSFLRFLQLTLTIRIIRLLFSLLPRPCSPDDIFEVVMLWIPTQPLLDLTALCDQLRRVALPPCGQGNGKIYARHFPGHGHDLTNAVAMSVPAIKHLVLPATVQVIARSHMGLGKVIDMDIVPDAGPVRCRVVSAENFQDRELPLGGLERPRDQMR